MTLVPWNARSELVIPGKFCGDGVCDTSRMFQIAEPASWSPAFNPTRGSGEGAAMSGADMSGTRSGVALVDTDDMDDELPQPARASDAKSRAPARGFFETIGNTRE